MALQGPGLGSEVAWGAGLAFGGASLPHESSRRTEYAVALGFGAFDGLERGFRTFDATVLARSVLKCSRQARRTGSRAFFWAVGPRGAREADVLRICPPNRRERSLGTRKAGRHPHVLVEGPGLARLAL